MSRQIAFALTMIAVLVGATVAADRVVAAPGAPTATFTEQIDVDSGAWYCVPVARDDETATLTISAVGDEESRVTVQNVGGGDAAFDDGGRRELAPGETEELEVPGGELPPGVLIRWRGAPVTASWEVTSRNDQRLGSTCTPSPSPRWLLSGANTVVGSNARLYLFNPFETDAVVRVAFATPEGRQDLVSSENLSVPAREVISVNLNELQPEQPDLGVIVEVDAGRVIATGLQRFGQPDLPDVELEGAEDVTADPSAPDGRTVLHAMPSDATSASFAYEASGEKSASWITVVNPNTRQARLSVTASDQIEGEAVPEEVVVGPESSERIDLETLSSSPNFGVTLTSTNDVGFVAHSFMALTGENPAVSSVAGVAEADPLTVAATAPEGTAPELALYNPGTAATTLSISVGGTVPGDWSGRELGPGEMQLLPFADAGVDPGAPVTVTADQPVLGTLRLSSEDSRATGFVTQPLVPANTWSGSSDALVPRRDETLESRPVDFPAQPDR